MKLLPDGVNKYELAQSILAARQQIATLSFVDDEFAEAGFLIGDDPRAWLEDGTQGYYRVETPDGEAVLSVDMAGTAAFQNRRDYGLRHRRRVPLRWRQPEDKEERSIPERILYRRRLDERSIHTNKR